ncbi:MAG: type II secretion system F family protein [Euryarchaeota archaeon]|nr:type II secretion system F family protein [Euryarchaeota archaeon]
MAGLAFWKPQRDLSLEEMYGPRIDAKTNYRFIIYAAAGIVAMANLIIALLLQFGAVGLGALTPLDFLVVALLAATGPVGFVENSRYQKIKALEEKLPEFLRDVAESGKFGMTLAASIRSAAKGRYGDLTPEIRRMAAQIGWGISATEALKLFSERVQTPVVKRTCGIIIKAASAGGNVADILTLVSTDIKESQLERAEKELNMTAYMVVIYVAFFVFLATVLILNAVFIPQIQSAGGDAGGDTGDMSGGVTSVNARLIPEVRFIYLASALIHGLGDGVTAGMLQNGQVANGLRHSFIMVFLAYLMLRVLLV